MEKPTTDSSILGTEPIYGDAGQNVGPSEISETGSHYDVYDYYGYSYNWTPGAQSSKMVLHYDGIWNNWNNSVPVHNSSATTWGDMSGHNYHGNIVNGNTTWRLLYNGTTISENDGRTSGLHNNTSWNANSLALRGNTYVLHDFVNNGNYTSNSIPSGNSSFTMEIVFYMDSNTTSKALIGSGYYNNNNQNQVWITPTQDSELKTISTVAGALKHDGKENQYDWAQDYTLVPNNHRIAFAPGAPDNFTNYGGNGLVRRYDITGGITIDVSFATVSSLYNDITEDRYSRLLAIKGEI